MQRFNWGKLRPLFATIFWVGILMCRNAVVMSNYSTNTLKVIADVAALSILIVICLHIFHSPETSVFSPLSIGFLQRFNSVEKVKTTAMVLSLMMLGMLIP